MWRFLMIKLIISFVKFIFSKNVILYFLLPVAGIIILFSYSVIAGIIGIFLYIMFLLYKNRARLFSFIGTINYSKGNAKNAVNWFAKAYKSNKAKPRTVTSYAYLLLKSGNLTEAKKILEKQINSKISKDNKMYAKSNLALVLWKQDRLKDAIEILENVIEEFENSTVYGSLGYFLILDGDMDRALEFNLKAYDYNNSNSIILDNLGQTYYLRGEYDKALEIFEKLIPDNPEFPEAYFNYGLTLYKKGEKEKALEYMRKSLNYKLSFLSTVTEDEIRSKIEEIEGGQV
jgi:tetratricopeptide (TPR) repeat protein